MKKDNNKFFIVLSSMMFLIVLQLIIVVALLLTSDNKNYSRTIMIYMVGSDLESQNGLASTDLKAIDKNVLSKQNINVYLIAGGSKEWNNDYISTDETSIFKLNSDGFTKVKEQDKVNMGDEKTLTNFLNYVYNDSKTDKYDLIFWNHGGGIDGSEYDELSFDDNLSLQEMNSAMSSSPFNKTNKLELIIFRTCLNGTIEVASTLEPYSNYLVASEESTLGANYTSVLNFINDIDVKDESKTIGKKFIEAYRKQVMDIKNKESLNMFKQDDTIYSTYSLVNLNRVDSLKNDVNEFFSDIDVSSNYNYISKVRANLMQYSSDSPAFDMVDLYNLVNNLKDLSPKKGSKVIEKLEQTILYNYATDSNSRGMSIYFPYNGENTFKEKFIKVYDNLNGFSNYQKFISTFYKEQTSSYKSYNYFSNKLSSSQGTNSYADFELELTDEQVETFAKAKYQVYRDLKTGYYKPIYTGMTTTLDGNKLKANIKDRQLMIVGSDNEKYDLTAFEVAANDDYIKYQTNIILQSFGDKISDWKNDNAVMTIYYNKKDNKIGVSNIVYSNDSDLSKSSAVNLDEYDNVVFSIASGWKVLDDNGNYTGPIIEDGHVVGDGIITGFEEKPGKFKFELSTFDNDYDYYAVFMITDTHNKVSYSKMIKLK